MTSGTSIHITKPRAQVIARGEAGTVEWAVMADGRSPAEEWVRTTKDIAREDRKRVQNVILRVAMFGHRYRNPDHFKLLDDEKEGGRAAKGLYEMRGHQLRLIGCFVGNRFLIVHGVIKKKNHLGRETIERADLMRQSIAVTDGQEDKQWRIF